MPCGRRRSPLKAPFGGRACAARRGPPLEDPKRRAGRVTRRGAPRLARPQPLPHTDSGSRSPGEEGESMSINTIRIIPFTTGNYPSNEM
eukprot:scaffold6712_cov269-Prasinococcus_capsulatus_cf.AAC.1